MPAQALAIGIFLVMFGLIITEKFPRHIVTPVCGLAMLALVFGLCMRSPAAIWEALSLYSIAEPSFWFHQGGASASTGINWETIFFLCGMMLMVEGMAAAGFFRWLCMTIVRRLRYRAQPIFVMFMLLSALLSMFIDSITVILFLAAVTVELSQVLEFDPVNMILPEIFCANLGGAATMCGDPPNIIIGTSLGLSFADFAANTGVMALLGLLVIVPYFYLRFRSQFRAAAPERLDPAFSPWMAIRNHYLFAFSCGIFLLTVVLLATHSLTGLTVSCIGALSAALTLLAAGRKAPLLLKKIDWRTLVFFIGLFVVVSGLEQTGVLKLLAGLIESASGGQPLVVIAIVLWGSGLASAFIDNIPFAATMIPVIRSLSASLGIDLHTLAWTLSMGTDIGGSATPIGASANVVGMSIAAGSGHPVSWGRYCRTMTLPTVLVVLLSMLVLFVRYF